MNIFLSLVLCIVIGLAWHGLKYQLRKNKRVR